MEDEFEIPSAHEHAVEHAAEKHVPLGQEVALFSAVLATLGAVVSFLGGHTQNEALYYKNEAVLMKARASDAWAYYQAEQIKQHLETTAADATPAMASKDKADAARYAAHARQLRQQAESFDARSDAADVESQHALSPHTRLAISMTFLQIAIALASITALTRRRWLLWAAGGFALVGVALGAIAWF
ncbi:DUF4337 domain-containing protein [uncultured Sphingomonas sp.]|uniref:DUF4337 domain-containing protein n=1 Tax=uncultured Sphingomonas sp. TaxID=158754 RepID=UPI0026175A88|nr:DUF4337 domain-containing protein [uncultured Sphingomonas sp.]